MRNRLAKLTLRGFKTIRKLEDFDPRSLTVLIGPNGAGKTNLISFFRLLSWTLTPPGGLQRHVAELGGASVLLHDGPARTREIDAALTVVSQAGENEYEFRLFHAAGDTLIYAGEKFRFSGSGFPSKALWTSLGAGHREPGLIAKAETGDKTARAIHSMLRKIIIHQFHNTSITSRMRDKWAADEGQWLKEDAANLAPFLYRLRNSEPGYYRPIVETVRLVLPFFSDFELEPEYGRLLLRWRESGNDLIFSASQAADGMLRVMALVSLLLQPERGLPDVLILDEPELGLHPYAIEVIAGLIRSVSTQVQVVVATQSVSLIDRFQPEDIVVVDRSERQSTFRRLNAPELKLWVDEYTLSQLWEKNVIGGRPSRDPVAPGR
ncbi:MAG: AAA family ATPase [Bryobacteraceae bacterium]